MKKRNIIFLVIDSLSYKTLESYPFPDELFLNNFVKKHSIEFTGVYTQGPYTEASMNGLAYGQRALDGSAFMYSHSKFSHSFVDNIHQDYHTFCSGMSCRLYVDHCKRSFDKYHYHFYTPTTLPTLQWNRVNHFCDIYKKRQLSDLEFSCLKELVEYSLKDSKSFLENYISKKYETSLSQGYLNNNDINNLLSLINSDLDAFHDNPEEYLERVLKREVDFSKYDFKYYTPYTDKDKANEVFNKYRPLLIKQAKKHYRFSFNFLKKYFVNLHNMSLSKKDNNCFKLFFEYAVSSFKKKRGIKKTYEKMLVIDNNKKRAVSFDASIKQIKSYIDDVSRLEKPFFIYCQPDDFHPISVFWTYDSPDVELLDKELSDALKLSKRIKTKNCNVFDYLSIKYVDNKVKEVFDYLSEKNLLDNTDIVITADHGSWSFNDAIRTDKNLVMTEERMHIPCLFFRSNQSHSNKEGNHNSYSIPNSILSFTGYKPDNYFYGLPFDIDENKYLLSENLGFGCPDLFHIPINYVVHNKQYKLNILVNFNEELTIDNCVGFYDLTKDKLEENNIIKKIKKKQPNYFREMLSVARNRHKEVQSSNTEEEFYKA